MSTGANTKGLSTKPGGNNRLKVTDKAPAGKSGKTTFAGSNNKAYSVGKLKSESSPQKKGK